LRPLPAYHHHNPANRVALESVQQGVYICQRGTDQMRIIVAGQVSKEPHNALLHLFSASGQRVGYGAGQYKRRSPDTSTLLGRLLGKYHGEGIAMSYTMNDFRRDYAKEHFKHLTPQEQREALESLTPEGQREVLQSLTPEVHREFLRRLPPEERLAGLSKEEISSYLQKLQAERPSRKGKPRRKS
jgi:hypothetical protein